MDKEISDYIKKQEYSQKEICQKIRKLILKTLPNIKEEMKWGVPVFGGGKFYIGAMKNQVNLGFSMNRLTKKEMAFFEGGGKTMRHIKIRTLKDIDKIRVVKLLRMVNSKSKCK